MATTDHTIRLGTRTYELLRKEAERRHLDVDATADGLLAENLSASPVDVAELAQTLDRAAQLRATLPATDEAVRLVREGRDELAERFERR
jgi:hypothetical protein